MKSKLKRLWVVLMVAFVSLVLTSLAIAQTPAWSLVVDTGLGAIDLMAETEMTITVSFSATAAVDNALVLCSVQSGQITTMSPGVYPLGGNGAVWSGDVVATEAFTLTIHPGAWPETRVPCVIVQAGQAQHAVTGTIAVTPFQAWLPLALNNCVTPATPQTLEIANPGGGYIFSYSGVSYAEALAGRGQTPTYIEEMWRGGWFQSARWSWPANLFYYVARSYLEFDTTGLPDDSIILSATLSLVVQNSDVGEIGDFSVHQGTWLALPDALAAWSAWQSETLAYQSAVVSGTVVNLTLPITSVSAGGVTKLALRMQPEEVPPERPGVPYANVFPRPLATLRITYLEPAQ